MLSSKSLSNTADGGESPPYLKRKRIEDQLEDLAAVVSGPTSLRNDKNTILEPKFSIGDLVDVAKRTWVGINKPGGVGRVTQVHVDIDADGDSENVLYTYDVRYVLGGSERGIEEHHLTQDPLRKATKQRNVLGRCRWPYCPCLVKDCGHLQPGEEPDEQTTSSSAAAAAAANGEGRASIRKQSNYLEDPVTSTKGHKPANKESRETTGSHDENIKERKKEEGGDVADGQRKRKDDNDDEAKARRRERRRRKRLLAKQLNEASRTAAAASNAGDGVENESASGIKRRVGDGRDVNQSNGSVVSGKRSENLLLNNMGKDGNDNSNGDKRSSDNNSDDDDVIIRKRRRREDAENHRRVGLLQGGNLAANASSSSGRKSISAGVVPRQNGGPYQGQFVKQPAALTSPFQRLFGDLILQLGGDNPDEYAVISRSIWQKIVRHFDEFEKRRMSENDDAAHNSTFNVGEGHREAIKAIPVHMEPKKIIDGIIHYQCALIMMKLCNEALTRGIQRTQEVQKDSKKMLAKLERIGGIWQRGEDEDAEFEGVVKVHGREALTLAAEVSALRSRFDCIDRPVEYVGHDCYNFIDKRLKTLRTKDTAVDPSAKKRLNQQHSNLEIVNEGLREEWKSLRQLMVALRKQIDKQFHDMYGEYPDDILANVTVSGGVGDHGDTLDRQDGFEPRDVTQERNTSDRKEGRRRDPRGRVDTSSEDDDDDDDDDDNQDSDSSDVDSEDNYAAMDARNRNYDSDELSDGLVGAITKKYAHGDEDEDLNPDYAFNLSQDSSNDDCDDEDDIFVYRGLDEQDPFSGWSRHTNRRPGTRKKRQSRRSSSTISASARRDDRGGGGGSRSRSTDGRRYDDDSDDEDDVVGIGRFSNEQTRRQQRYKQSKMKRVHKSAKGNERALSDDSAQGNKKEYNVNDNGEDDFESDDDVEDFFVVPGEKGKEGEKIRNVHDNGDRQRDYDGRVVRGGAITEYYPRVTAGVVGQWESKTDMILRDLLCALHTGRAHLIRFRQSQIELSLGEVAAAVAQKMDNHASTGTSHSELWIRHKGCDDIEFSKKVITDTVLLYAVSRLVGAVDSSGVPMLFAENSDSFECAMNEIFGSLLFVQEMAVGVGATAHLNTYKPSLLLDKGGIAAIRHFTECCLRFEDLLLCELIEFINSACGTSRGTSTHNNTSLLGYALDCGAKNEEAPTACRRGALRVFDYFRRKCWLLHLGASHAQSGIKQLIGKKVVTSVAQLAALRGHLEAYDATLEAVWQQILDCLLERPQVLSRACKLLTGSNNDNDNNGPRHLHGIDYLAHSGPLERLAVMGNNGLAIAIVHVWTAAAGSVSGTAPKVIRPPISSQHGPTFTWVLIKKALLRVLKLILSTGRPASSIATGIRQVGDTFSEVSVCLADSTATMTTGKSQKDPAASSAHAPSTKNDNNNKNKGLHAMWMVIALNTLILKSLAGRETAQSVSGTAAEDEVNRTLAAAGVIEAPTARSSTSLDTRALVTPEYITGCWELVDVLCTHHAFADDDYSSGVRCSDGLLGRGSINTRAELRKLVALSMVAELARLWDGAELKALEIFTHVCGGMLSAESSDSITGANANEVCAAVPPRPQLSHEGKGAKQSVLPWPMRNVTDASNEVRQKRSAELQIAAKAWDVATDFIRNSRNKNGNNKIWDTDVMPLEAKSLLLCKQLAFVNMTQGASRSRCLTAIMASDLPTTGQKNEASNAIVDVEYTLRFLVKSMFKSFEIAIPLTLIHGTGDYRRYSRLLRDPINVDANDLILAVIAEFSNLLSNVVGGNGLSAAPAKLKRLNKTLLQELSKLLAIGSQGDQGTKEESSSQGRAPMMTEGVCFALAVTVAKTRVDTALFSPEITDKNREVIIPLPSPSYAGSLSPSKMCHTTKNCVLEKLSLLFSQNNVTEDSGRSQIACMLWLLSTCCFMPLRQSIHRSRISQQHLSTAPSSDPRASSSDGEAMFTVGDRNSLDPLLTCVQHAIQWYQSEVALYGIQGLSTFTKTLYMVSLNALCVLLAHVTHMLTLDEKGDSSIMSASDAAAVPQCVDAISSTMPLTVCYTGPGEESVKVPVTRLIHNDLLLKLSELLSIALSENTSIGPPHSTAFVSAIYGCCVFVDALALRVCADYTAKVNSATAFGRGTYGTTVSQAQDEDIATCLKFVEDSVVKKFFRHFYPQLLNSKVVSEMHFRSEECVLFACGVRMAAAMGDIVLISCVATLHANFVSKSTTGRSTSVFPNDHRGINLVAVVPSLSTMSSPDVALISCLDVLDRIFSLSTPLCALFKAVLWTRILEGVFTSDLPPLPVPQQPTSASVAYGLTGTAHTITGSQSRMNALPVLPTEAVCTRELCLSLVVLHAPSLVQLWITCACVLPLNPQLLVGDLHFDIFHEMLAEAAKGVLTRPVRKTDTSNNNQRPPTGPGGMGQAGRNGLPSKSGDVKRSRRLLSAFYEAVLRFNYDHPITANSGLTYFVTKIERHVLPCLLGYLVSGEVMSTDEKNASVVAFNDLFLRDDMSHIAAMSAKLSKDALEKVTLLHTIVCGVNFTRSSMSLASSERRLFLSGHVFSLGALLIACGVHPLAKRALAQTCAEILFPCISTESARDALCRTVPLVRDRSRFGGVTNGGGGISDDGYLHDSLTTKQADLNVLTMHLPQLLQLVARTPFGRMREWTVLLDLLVTSYLYRSAGKHLMKQHNPSDEDATDLHRNVLIAWALALALPSFRNEMTAIHNGVQRLNDVVIPPKPQDKTLQSKWMNDCGVVMESMGWLRRGDIRAIATCLETALAYDWNSSKTSPAHPSRSQTNASFTSHDPKDSICDVRPHTASVCPPSVDSLTHDKARTFVTTTTTAAAAVPGSFGTASRDRGIDSAFRDMLLTGKGDNEWVAHTKSNRYQSINPAVLISVRLSLSAYTAAIGNVLRSFCKSGDCGTNDRVSNKENDSLNLYLRPSGSSDHLQMSLATTALIMALRLLRLISGERMSVIDPAFDAVVSVGAYVTGMRSTDVTWQDIALKSYVAEMIETLLVAMTALLTPFIDAPRGSSASSSSAQSIESSQLTGSSEYSLSADNKQQSSQLTSSSSLSSNGQHAVDLSGSVVSAFVGVVEIVCMSATRAPPARTVWLDKTKFSTPLDKLTGAISIVECVTKKEVFNEQKELLASLRRCARAFASNSVETASLMTAEARAQYDAVLSRLHLSPSRLCSDVETISSLVKSLSEESGQSFQVLKSMWEAQRNPTVRVALMDEDGCSMLRKIMRLIGKYRRVVPQV